MTRTDGRLFISYKRERQSDVARLVTWLHLLGIPTWRDLDDLAHAPLDRELREILDSEETSGALLYITPEVRDSPVIRTLEVPLSVERGRIDRDFAVLPVLAGGLGYDAVDAIFEEYLGGVRLSTWNLLRVASDPLSNADALDCAARALKMRLERVCRAKESSAPLVVQFNTRVKCPWEPDVDLFVDWHAHFDSRLANGSAWADMLRPALSELQQALVGVSQRAIHIRGQATLSAAFALGVALRSVTGKSVAWLQRSGGEEAPWQLEPPASGASLPVVFDQLGGTIGAGDVALLVSVNGDTRVDFARVRGSLPPLREVLVADAVGREDGKLLTAAEASAAVCATIQQLRGLRERVQATSGAVHLFMAAPVGFAFLLGRLSNTLPRVVVYEHMAGGDPPYVAAATVEPSR